MNAAVIDIGSNSIKLLVASRAADGQIVTLARRTEETRIGTGITGSPPRLQEESMQRATESVQALLCAAQAFEPARTAIVATSAVRDAVNGPQFADMLFDACGQELIILAGTEEARLIGRGIACDPALAGIDNFYLFDLGGGSLEMLEFQDGAVAQLASLQLGCVRVTEKYIQDASHALTPAAVDAIKAGVSEALRTSGFRFKEGNGPVAAVVTGGTATVFRAMKAATAGVNLEAMEPTITLIELDSLAATLAAETLDERKKRAGLPPERADVMPAALITLAETARIAGATSLRHSMFNLRYGMAAELLGKS